MTPWGPRERLAWRDARVVQRSYHDDVIQRIERLHSRFDVLELGVITTPGRRFPVYGLRSPDWSPDRPTALITGGVHGYETSGVHGALAFAEQALDTGYNLAIAPCISPWAYEVIHRWNADAIDPNRHFVPDSPAEECRALMRFVATLGPVHVHIDLHETTDSDNTEFRPAKAARDGIEQAVWDIPDGFYLVGRTDRPALDFQKEVCASVAEVTHLAAADADGRLIGEPTVADGVILYDAVGLGLCMGLTDAPFTTTTEVYPDSPRVDAEQCVRAQVAAIRGALRAAGATPSTD